MTDTTTDELDLAARLKALGDELALDDSEALVAEVLARLDDDVIPPRVRRSHRSTWGWVAAAVVVVVAALAAVPSSRGAIADWFGLDGVDIDQDPDLSVPNEPPTVTDAETRGSGTVVDVGGTAVLVGEIEIDDVLGTLDERLVSKTLSGATDIERVDVDGQPGLWIDGAPHVVVFMAPDGNPTTERFAGNTLLWQDGSVIRRLEGFETLEAALAYATR